MTTHEGATGRTLSGRYAVVPEPCTTQPCLPGVAYAVESGGEVLIVTVGRQWSSLPHSWDGYEPRLGDRVTVTGEVTEMIDAKGQRHRLIEAGRVVPDR